MTAASVAAAVKGPAIGPSDPIAGKPIGQLNYEGMQDPRFAARVTHYLADHGLGHPFKADLAGKTPLAAAAKAINVEKLMGRTPAEWVSLAKAENLAALRPLTYEKGDLVDDIVRIDADAASPLTSYQKEQLARDVAALQPDIRVALADLVHALRLAYEAQSPVANGVMARFATAHDATDVVLTTAEREASLTNALSVIAAENAFRDAVKNVHWPDTSTPIFRDPAGLVIVGSTGNDVYAADGVLRDPILIVDPAGDDTYYNSAGGACPDVANYPWPCNGLVLSTVLDLQGNDKYLYSGVPMSVQGAGSIGGIGILYDVSGDDTYTADLVRGNTAGLTTYVDATQQGGGTAGVGILLDLAGNDTRTVTVRTTNNGIWDMSQGFGDVGGIGILADGAGNDTYQGFGFNAGDLGTSFQGMYPMGTGFFGGVGVLADTGRSDDKYYAWDNATTTDYYAQGFGAFGGVGIFYEDGGNDDYQAVEMASTGDAIVPLLNCAFGTGSLAGVGIMLEMGGNDHYYGDTVSPRGAYTQNEGFGGPGNAYGLFVDVSGDDGHFMYAHGGTGPSQTWGRGVLVVNPASALSLGSDANMAGTFLDLGGNDQYAGASPSRDNAVWADGADLNAGSVPSFLLGGR